jgi:hypothetical protein
MLTLYIILSEMAERLKAVERALAGKEDAFVELSRRKRELAAKEDSIQALSHGKPVVEQWLASSRVKVADWEQQSSKVTAAPLADGE